MKKEEILSEIKLLASQKLLTKEEILAAYEGRTPGQDETASTRQRRISAILYYIGGIIVILGIVILVAQHWSTLNNSTKILLTLGSGIAAFMTGILLSRYENLSQISQSFYFISGLLTPSGLHITLDLAGLDVGSKEIQSLISGFLLGIYLISYRILKRKMIFLIFSIISGTWFYCSFVPFLLADAPFFTSWRFHAYRMLVIALSYLLLGYYLSQDSKATARARHTLSQWLLGIGVFGFLGTTLALGGWSPDQSVLWELLFPGLVFGILFLSIPLKNRSFLLFGSLYLMAYIVKISAEYFEKSLGWPLCLVLMGFLLMGIGYFAFYLNKKYMV